MIAETRSAPTGGLRSRMPRAFRTIRGQIGLALLVFVLSVAILGPLFAPHPLAQPIGVPGTGPSSGAPLGTDSLGRDVLSRLFDGGLPVLGLAVASVALTYLVGTVVGMCAGLLRSWTDALLMRVLDLFIVFPPLLLLLVLISGAGDSDAVLVIGIVLVLFPGVARVVRSATVEVALTGYVEAAVTRGESIFAIMRREVLPNTLPTLVADAGVRFFAAIFLVASLNFLGFGAQPPAANWGLMISENRVVLATNVWSVLAPTIMLALLMFSVNLVGDAFVESLARSGGEE